MESLVVREGRLDYQSTRKGDGDQVPHSELLGDALEVLDMKRAMLPPVNR